VVRTITIEDPNAPAGSKPYSYELCGGTHLNRTSDVGAFLIISESSAAAGVRRIEAVTGRGAYKLVARRFKILKETANTLKSAVDEVPLRAMLLQEELAASKKQAAALKAELALSTFDLQLPSQHTVEGVNLLAIEMPNVDKDTLGKLADKFRKKNPARGVCTITTVNDGQIIVMTTVTQDLIKQGIKAGELAGYISRQLGGGGGGAPHLAYGGGKDATKIPAAIASVKGWLEGKLK
jgi:alanyl-tRNA synthetase